MTEVAAIDTNFFHAALLHVLHGPEGMLAIVSRPRKCAGCGTAHFLFVNRDGRTACIACGKNQLFAGTGYITVGRAEPRSTGESRVLSG
jgi:hypothetical protein